MPHSEAMQELVAAAEQVIRGGAVGHIRLEAAVAAVEAEDKSQTQHQFGAHGTYRMRCNDCGQPAHAPVHQIGGNK